MYVYLPVIFLARNFLKTGFYNLLFRGSKRCLCLSRTILCAYTRIGFFWKTHKTEWSQSIMPIIGRAGHLRLFLIFIKWKMLSFAHSIEWIWLGVGYFNKPETETGHIYIKIFCELTFQTTLQNRKLQNAQLCRSHRYVPPCAYTFTLP